VHSKLGKIKFDIVVNNLITKLHFCIHRQHFYIFRLSFRAIFREHPYILKDIAVQIVSSNINNTSIPVQQYKQYQYTGTTI